MATERHERPLDDQPWTEIPTLRTPPPRPESSVTATLVTSLDQHREGRPGRRNGCAWPSAPPLGLGPDPRPISRDRLDGPPRRMTRLWHEPLAGPCAPAIFGPGPHHPDQPTRPARRSLPARSDPPTPAPSQPDPRCAHPPDQPDRPRCLVTLAHDLCAPPDTRTTRPIPAPTSRAASSSTTDPKKHSKPCRDPVAIPKRPGVSRAPGLPPSSPSRFGRDRGILESRRDSRLRTARPHSAPSRSYLTPGVGRVHTPLPALCWPRCRL